MRDICHKLAFDAPIKMLCRNPAALAGVKTDSIGRFIPLYSIPFAMHWPFATAWPNAMSGCVRGDTPMRLTIVLQSSLACSAGSGQPRLISAKKSTVLASSMMVAGPSAGVA